MQFTSPTPLLYHPSTKNPAIRHQSLLSLCSWWESTHAKEDPLPHICYQFTSPQKLQTGLIAPPMEFNFARVASDMLLDKADGDDEADKDVVDVEHSVHSVGRSIGLVGIGLGVVVMLLIIAFITCLRRRKIVQVRTVREAIITVRKNKNQRQAEAELGQAQLKLELGFTST